MNTLSVLLQAVLRHPYGFIGVQGFAGVILGLIVFLVVFLALWQVFGILARKFAWDGDIVTIVKILVGLLIFLWFLQLIFGIFS